jgi:surface-anchored protein
MEKILKYLIAGALVFLAPSVWAQCFYFTEEHVDLLGVTWNSASNQLSLMASDDTHGLSYASNQCVVVCPESMKFTLPAGMPLGNEGDNLWILPQNSYAGTPYVGVSAQQIPAGVFYDPFVIRLTRMEGPGQFMLWQATTFGSLDLKMDTRDGIGTNDAVSPLVGAHEHYNWGFTTSGVYRLYFQVSGLRMGEATNTVSPETPFTFHILPLSPFENWTATNWPCGCDTNLIAATADPDEDRAPNAWEYASGTDPNAVAARPSAAFSFVYTNGLAYGAMTFTHAKSATDATFEVVAGGGLKNSGWEVLTNVHLSVDLGSTERITLRDNAPVSPDATRFYELRLRIP